MKASELTAIVRNMRYTILLSLALVLLVAQPTSAATIQPVSSESQLVVILWDGEHGTLGVVDEHGRFSARVTVPDPAGRGLRVSLSPDSRRAAVIALAGADRDPAFEATLFVANLSSGELQPIAEGADAAGTPVWSSDGSQIAFRRTSIDEGGKQHDEIWTVPAEGGEPVPAAVHPDADGLYLIGWPAEGLMYFAITPGGSYLFHGGQPEPIRLAETPVRDVSVSPDSRWTAFSIYGSAPRLGILGPDGIQVTAAPGPFVHPAWNSRNELTIAGRPGSGALKLGGEGVPVTALSAGRTAVDLPVAWSPDSTRLAARSIEFGQDGRPLTEQLVILGTDGSRTVIHQAGYLEALGWTGD